jgi:hypothetical protein
LSDEVITDHSALEAAGKGSDRAVERVLRGEEQSIVGEGKKSGDR